ncbi:hypothetical protein [Brunnivagina elsteri]|uniref:Uncharacterized protein n=1 Tax=Brunnivagina elsteri CCALA 953 TaxID=987040 RepID=A0A2A2TK16_9CYAN|nr:hypothetical protein [Calothrix elsteri]PAX55909.1 hypothetical protein CK510_10720 [Calothrix elsteri CCALA 953]
MNSKINNFRNSIQLVGIIFGGLVIGLPAISQTVQAQQPVNVPGSQVNPCPKIFYEEPHNNRVPVPQGCPPNAFTNRMNTQGTNSSSTQTQLGVGGEAPDSNVIIQQSSIYQRTQQNSQNNSRINSRLSGRNRYEKAVAAVSPTDGKVSILLMNQTNAPIVYQAIGDTQQRILPGRSQVTLQGLNTPANVTFYRQDRGLLMVTPQSSPQGILKVTLQETTDFAMDRTALRIEKNGVVYLN